MSLPTLDEAWKAAEEALPEGWELHLSRSLFRGGFTAYANQYRLVTPTPEYEQPVESIPFPESHPTAVEALLALADALRVKP